MSNLELSDARTGRHHRVPGASGTSVFARRQKLQAGLNIGLVSVAFLFIVAVVLGVFP